MNWYAAHIISYVKFTDNNQDSYPIWEYVILIETDTSDAAWEAAESIGRSEYDGTDSDFTWNDRPARQTFAGVRKIIACQDTTRTAIARGSVVFRPGNNTEITYSELELSNEEDLLRFVAGESVQISYVE